MCSPILTCKSAGPVSTSKAARQPTFGWYVKGHIFQVLTHHRAVERRRRKKRNSWDTRCWLWCDCVQQSHRSGARRPLRHLWEVHHSCRRRMMRIMTHASPYLAGQSPSDVDSWARRRSLSGDLTASHQLESCPLHASTLDSRLCHMRCLSVDSPFASPVSRYS